MSARIRVVSPLPYQVFQRSDCNTADIRFECSYTEQSVCSVHFRLGSKAGHLGKWEKAELSDGSFVGIVHDVPIGGPYTLDVEARDSKGDTIDSNEVRELLVGDLWVLAGQSNMYGHGKLDYVESPHRMVHAYYYDESWDTAKDPLCSLNESIDPVHWEIQDEKKRKEFNRKNKRERQIGAGLGVRFGKDLYKATHVPVGLIVCPEGGTNMVQWSPALKSEGGHSLYGSMFRRIDAVGGKIAGFLWYQGENDALYPPEGKPYKDNFREFIKSLRSDLNASRLPFIFAQLGLVYECPDPIAGAIGWNAAKSDQLSLSSELENLAIVATLDSSLADYIHLDSISLRRVGARMALMARRMRFGENGIESGPIPAKCSFIDSKRTRVRLTFSGANGKLRPAKGIIGFSIESVLGCEEIASCTIDKDNRHSVIIELVRPISLDSFLWHGRGLNPVCNMKDGLGLPVPAFGPILIESAPAVSI